MSTLFITSLSVLKPLARLLPWPNLGFEYPGTQPGRTNPSGRTLETLRQVQSWRGSSTVYRCTPGQLVVTVLRSGGQLRTFTRLKRINADIRHGTRHSVQLYSNPQPRLLTPRAAVHFRMRDNVHDAVMRALGEHQPERGGLLGGCRASGEISHFWLDASPTLANSSTYEPNVRCVNAQLKRWNSQGIDLVGMVHSHPGRLGDPSHADCQYARDILRAVPKMQRFFMPIVLTKPQAGAASLHPYVVERDSPHPYSTCRLTLTADQLLLPGC